MTSQQRHEARYKRRKAAREAKRRAFTAHYDDFDRATSVSALIHAHWAARKGVMWKASVCRYHSHFFKNSRLSHRRLIAGEDVREGFYNFQIVERGKPRDVHSLHYRERVIRRAICVNALVPILSHDLIYDNGASLKGKGISFSTDRCAAELREWYRRYGDNEGWVLTIDFRKFFDNIQHVPLLQNLDKHLHDKRLYTLSAGFIMATGAKGLYIGPEDSQIDAIAFPNGVDHFIKDQYRIRCYKRYMDDSRVIMRDKAALLRFREALFKRYAELGIVINPKKTQIIALRRGFTYLKTQYTLTKTGRVIQKPCRDSVIRQRRKLKSFRRFLDAGEMTQEQINGSYMSWRGSLKSKNAHKTIVNTDKLFFRLFAAKPWIKKTKKRKGKINHD